MTLLEEFIYSQSKIERAKLRPLQFRDAKRKIFLKILACRTQLGIRSRDIAKQYKLSTRRFNQMSAEMLQACYDDVVPTRGLDLLLYLGTHQLYRHYYKEMVRQERVLIVRGDKKELERYYFTVLLTSEFFMVPNHYNITVRSEIARYLTRYIEVKEPRPTDRYLIRVTEIEQTIDRLFGERFDQDEFECLVNEYESILEQVRSADCLFLRYKLAYNLGTIYRWKGFPGRTPDVHIQYLQQLMADYPTYFHCVEAFIKLGWQASAIPQTDDIDRYKQYVRQPPSNGEVSSLLFVEHFFPFMVAAGELTWAKKFIADHFPFNIDRLHKETALRWWRLLLIYHIYRGEFEEASSFLQKSLLTNTGRARNSGFEINLRCYSIFLTVMLHGPELALEEVQRHIRYGRRHGYGQSGETMIKYLRTMNALLSCPTFDKVQSKKIRDDYHAELKREDRCDPLFEQIYTTYYL